jgi:ABC-type transporter Mla MlaB component
MRRRRRHIRVVGELDQAAAELRLARCRQIADGGCRAVIDMSGVCACDREGLAALRQLQDGHLGVNADVAGVKWSQFLAVLQATPLDALNDVHRDIRLVLGDHELGQVGPTRPGARELHRRQRSRPRTIERGSITLPTS